MNRDFLNAFADLAKKPYKDEYGRDDVIAFRNDRRAPGKTGLQAGFARSAALSSRSS